MFQDRTEGPASAYQLTYGTERSELGVNMLDTGGVLAIPIRLLETESDLEKFFEREVVSIRIPPQYEELAFHVLSRASQFQSLPDHVYALPRSDLRLLDNSGIPYEKVGWR